MKVIRGLLGASHDEAGGCRIGGGYMPASYFPIKGLQSTIAGEECNVTPDWRVFFTDIGQSKR